MKLDERTTTMTATTVTRTITIDPVTRIEGHAKITIQLDASGQVEDAHFHVTQFRGFEKLVQGRPFREMPSLMARTCGICPVSHLIAASKACDELLAVRVPPAAVKLRKIMNLAQIVQSHALSFFYLSSPDLLLGLDSDPAKRNIFGVLEAEPELARGGVRLAPVWAERHRSLGRQTHPSRLGDSRRRSRTAHRREARSDSPDHPGGEGVCPANAGGVFAHDGEFQRGNRQLRQFPHHAHGLGFAAQHAGTLRRQSALD